MLLVEGQCRDGKEKSMLWRGICAMRLELERGLPVGKSLLAFHYRDEKQLFMQVYTPGARQHTL